MPRPACTPPVLSAPLFLESLYEYNQRFKQFGSVGPDLGPHCLQTKNDSVNAPPPTHPWNCTLRAHVDKVRGSMSIDN